MKAVLELSNIEIHFTFISLMDKIQTLSIINTAIFKSVEDKGHTKTNSYIKKMRFYFFSKIALFAFIFRLLLKQITK